MRPEVGPAVHREPARWLVVTAFAFTGIFLLLLVAQAAMWADRVRRVERRA